MRSKSTKGFTLIELVVALAVLAILLTIAIPSFLAFRQRAALRGAGDQLMSAWADARFEALRRNQRVKIGLKVDASNGFCVGVATTSTANDDAACDCFTANSCNVNAYPAPGTDQQAEWRQVSFVGKPTLGDDDSDDQGVAVIDPKRGGLTEPADVGGIALKSPAGNPDYRLNFTVDANGRAYLCEPADAPSKLPQFTSRRC